MRKLTAAQNVNAPNADYPKGRSRDKTVTEPGTIFSEILAGDIIQFFQKLIISASITENDLPDNVTNGYQLFEALVYAINENLNDSGWIDLLPSEKVNMVDGKAKQVGKVITIKATFDVTDPTGGSITIFTLPEGIDAPIIDGVGIPGSAVQQQQLGSPVPPVVVRANSDGSLRAVQIEDFVTAKTYGLFITYVV